MHHQPAYEGAVPGHGVKRAFSHADFLVANMPIMGRTQHSSTQQTFQHLPHGSFDFVQRPSNPPSSHLKQELLSPMIAKYLMEPPTSKQLSASSTQIPLYHAHSQESVTHGRREVKTSHDTPFAHDDEYWRRNPLKPPFSYRTLVAKALYAAGVKGRTLKEIYDWIEENFAYFRTATSGNGASWRSSIRHNLVSHSEFNRVIPGETDSAEAVERLKKRPRWCLTPEYYSRLGGQPPSHNSPGSVGVASTASIGGGGAPSAPSWASTARFSPTRAQGLTCPSSSAPEARHQSASAIMRRSASLPVIDQIGHRMSGNLLQHARALGTLAESSQMGQLVGPQFHTQSSSSSIMHSNHLAHVQTCPSLLPSHNSSWQQVRAEPISTQYQHASNLITTPVMHNSTSNIFSFPGCDSLDVSITALDQVRHHGYTPGPIDSADMQQLTRWLMDS